MVAGAVAPPECGDGTCQPADHDRANVRLVRGWIGGLGLCGIAISSRSAVGVVVGGVRASAGAASFIQWIGSARLESVTVDFRLWSTRAAERAGGVSGVGQILSRSPILLGNGSLPVHILVPGSRSRNTFLSG